MGRIWFCVLSILVAGFVADAQRPVGETITTGRSVDTVRRMQEALEARNKAENDRRKRIGDSGNKEKAARFKAHLDAQYRTLTKEESDLLAPDPSYLSKYAAFLNDPNTGIVVLVPEQGCSNSSLVMDASEECLKYSMPGAGASYSFRAEKYRTRRIADITLFQAGLQTRSFRQFGMFAELGEVSLDSLTSKTPEITFLASLKPEFDNQKSVIRFKNIKDVIKEGGPIYLRTIDPNVGKTFLLRTIALKGQSLRAFEGTVYDEFSFDKRRDIIIAFRVIDRAEDGRITLLWKKLANVASPKYKPPDVPNRPTETARFATGRQQRLL